MSGEWTDAEIEMPDCDTDVIIATTDGEVSGGFYDGQKWRWMNAESIAVRVTHWQNYPDAP